MDRPDHPHSDMPHCRPSQEASTPSIATAQTGEAAKEATALQLRGSELETQNRFLREAPAQAAAPAPERTLDEAADIRFEDLFDIADIQRIQDEFAAATCVASIITRPDGTPITKPSRFTRFCRDIVRKTELGCANCMRSDALLGAPHPGGPLVQPCLSGGLWDAGASITVGGRHIANWLIGQVRNEQQTEDAMRAYARRIGADEQAVVEAFRDVPSMKQEQFERIAQALYTLANQLSSTTYQNALQVRFIAEIRRAQEALKESESRLRSIGDNIPGGALFQLLVSPDGSSRYTYVSAGVEKILGFTAQEIQNDFHAFWHTVVDEDRALIEHAQQKSMSDLTLFDCEFRQRRTSGEIRWLLARSTPRRTEGGATLWDGVVTDITERKQAEADHIRLMAAIEQSNETVVITDVNGVIQYVNPAFVTSSGYCREEVIGKRPGFLKSGVQDEAFYRQLWETILSGKTWCGRLTNRRKDGRLYTEDVTISPVRDTAGHIVNFVAVKRDITEHLLLTSQLQQAQKMESVGRLAGGVAHDFNNMLSVISGYAEFALEKLPSDHPIRADLQEILKASQHSADLTKQLLAFARKQTVIPKVLDLNENLAGMLNMLRRLIGENVSLLWDPCPSALFVKVDPSQLNQILANLSVNARDAISGAGHLAITTRLADIDAAYCAEHTEAAPGRYARIAVRDDGCGMSPKTLEHLFEPFFTTKGPGKGTGLGLATIYGIVKQNRGFINVRSEPARGTTFEIFIPLHSEQAAQASAAAQNAPQSAVTILLVEDEPAILAMCEKMLTAMGHRVLAAHSPREAIELSAQHAGEIRLLMTDVVMQEMNGRDLALRIQQSRPKIRCLFMSGFTANVIARHGIIKDHVHFIQKPFQRETLAAKLNEVLSAAGSDLTGKLP